MKRFTFPLEKALEWRSQQADIEQARLDAIVAEERALERQSHAVEDVRKESEVAVRSAEHITAVDLAALDSYQTWAGLELARLRASISACGRRVQEQRGRVVEARRNLGLLKKLRERRLAEWEADAARSWRVRRRSCFWPSGIGSVGRRRGRPGRR
jgi:hypothetical protein